MRSARLRGLSGPPAHWLWLVVSWGGPLLFLGWAARLVAIEGYLSELPKDFSGDFNSAVTGAGLDPGQWWAGQGLFYGPLFVLEWLLVLRNGALSIANVARLDFILFGVAFVCTWRTLFAELRPRLLVLVLGLWLANYVSVALFATAQHLEVLELMFLALALLLLVQGRLAAAGISLGLAVATKTLPVVFLPYLAIMRRWRMLWLAVAVSASLFAIACFVQHVSPLDGAIMLVNQGTNLEKTKSTPYEVGLRAYFIRALTAGQGDPTPQQTLVAFSAHAAIALATVVYVARLVQRIRPTRRAVSLTWGVLSATMLVVAPVTHVFYFVFLLPGWTAVLAELIERPLDKLRAVQWIGLGACYICAGFDQPFVLLQRVFGVGQPILDHWLDLLPIALFLTLAVEASLLYCYHPSGEALPRRAGPVAQSARAQS